MNETDAEEMMTSPAAADVRASRAELAALAQRRDERRRRRRDLLVAAGLAGTVFTLLGLSGSIGWGVAVTAFGVFAMALTAYIVASGPQRGAARPATGEESALNDNAPSCTPALESVLSALTLPAFALDHRLRVIFANVPASLLMRAGTVRDVPVSAMVRRPELLRMIETTRATGEPNQMEIVFAGATDQVFLARVRAIRVGPETGILVVFEDRTAVRRAERARADFLANASHELRTPLASLAGFIETMRGPAKDDKDSWDRFLEIMYTQTERMRRLIHDLLSLSRIELSEHTVPESVVDLALIAQEGIEALIPQAQASGRSVRYVGVREGVSVIGSRDELAQVVQNLLDNALKYTPAGGDVVVSVGQNEDGDTARLKSGRQWEGAHRLTITQSPHGTNRSYAWLRVRDTGPGIPGSSLPRLGERFYRVDESRASKVAGTGLGLAIVKHIMARHRGGFGVESVLGEGTAFGIWLAQPLENEETVAAVAQ